MELNRRDAKDAERKFFKLAVSVPHPHDGTSFYRAIGPLAAMSKVSEGKFSYQLPPLVNGAWELTWDWLAPCDGLFLRPKFPVHGQLCRLAKQMKLPVWVDFDDDLTCLPASNPHAKELPDEETMRATIKDIVSLADFVSVSTPVLAERIGGGNKTKVIPNALMHDFYHDEKRQRRVSWRGSRGHDEDLFEVGAAVTQLGRLPQFGKWNWLFMGDAPWLARRMVPATRAEFDEGTGLQFFVALLSAYAPWVNMVPLANHAFNRAKSNIAWIESSCAGALTVAPDWEEWRRPGVINYAPGDAKSFEETLRGVMNGYQEEIAQGVREARAHIQKHLLLNSVNQQRWEIIERMK